MDGKTVTILYLGDWDPSGKDIERDLILRHGQYGLAADIVDAACDIDLQRIAIFKEDIAESELPPLQVRVRGSRASQFKRHHGDEPVELDALRPTELRARLRHAIEDLIDHEAWNRAKLGRIGTAKDTATYDIKTAAEDVRNAMAKLEQKCVPCHGSVHHRGTNSRPARSACLSKLT